MDVEVKFALDVMGPEFSKMGFVPDNDVRMADFMETGPTREECVHDRGYVFKILEQELSLKDESA
jgi:hypothetical protein